MKEKWLAFYRENKTAVWFAGIGLVLAILVLTINLWRTLLLLVLVVLGFAIGKGLDEGKTVLQTLYDLYRAVFKRDR